MANYIKASHSSVAVFADDLTGACDTGLAFFRGQSAVVATGANPFFEKPLAKPLPELLAINLACRNSFNKATANELAAWWQRCHATHRVYLKMDSTLRGYWPATIKRVYDLSEKPLVVCPAYPAAGRITYQGCHYVDTIPVHQTIVGQDPQAPVLTSHLPTLAQQSGLQPQHLDTTLLDKPIGELTQSVQWFIQHGAQCLTCDATNNEHLTKLAKVIAELELIPCGSAGLAHALANVWLGQGDFGISQPLPNLPQLPTETPVVVVSGSQTPLTNKQIKAFQQANISNTTMVISHGKHVTPDAWANHLKQHVQQVGEKLLDISQSLWLLCGGETTAQTLSALGVNQAQLVGAVAPNIACLQVKLANNHTAWCVVKSGNFGERDTLINTVNCLRPS